ncbi:MAG: DegT/DnrJ/EryC1/StrS family aminotransferase [Actinomycetota bacterium]|nr:DegT/DnrJ/EryC1/StrS family aminotransferase [Actinomycetota bacterium]MDD5601141.1 DegT/DnrJ/EryC1/StrS family aminotransferase [Actinomycetota bacterium]
MEFIDLKAQQNLIREKIEDNIKKVLDHGKYIMGPEVFELEEKLSNYVGIKHAISCSSGTDALLMSLMAYDIGPGDYVITTPFTFISTAEVVALLGAKPVFIDIDENTYNISPQKIREFLNNPVDPANGKEINHKNIKGIIAVDIFGLPADYEKINNIAKEYNMFVIEDAAQSFGAEFKGRKACSLSDIGCTSFFPSKPLGCYGDGGMIFTDNDDLAEILRSIRVHGKGKDKYDNIRPGINGRLDTIQAAILLAKFEIFPEEIEKRQEVAQRYSEALSEKFYLQEIPEGYKSARALYSIRPKKNNRGYYLNLLKENNIPSAIYYPKPLHLQKAFAYLGYRQGYLVVSEECSENIFSIPFCPYIDKTVQYHVLRCLLNDKSL